MSRRYYSNYRGNGANTCSIRSLKNAHIGAAVRMTADKTKTVPFENIPMKGMLIEKYDQLGFFISHPNLPKKVYVNFDQLPLTRLIIKNGVIEDEITFVENIVNHKMQLIRTSDTEYLDMLFKEKALETKQDEIIPITQAIPGQVYIGAQCEEGNEMIYLGTFFVKETKIETHYNRSYGFSGRNDSNTYSTYMHKLTPQRAFFAIPAEELTTAEETELEKKYYGNDRDARWKSSWDDRQLLDKKIAIERKEILANSPVPRFKILDFAITSKRIKQLIITHKENNAFIYPDMNKAAIIGSKYANTNIAYPAVNFTISNRWYSDGSYMSKSKETIEDETREFFQTYKGIAIESCYYEDRYNK